MFELSLREKRQREREKSSKMLNIFGVHSIFVCVCVCLSSFCLTFQVSQKSATSGSILGPDAHKAFPNLYYVFSLSPLSASAPRSCIFVAGTFGYTEKTSKNFELADLPQCSWNCNVVFWCVFIVLRMPNCAKKNTVSALYFPNKRNPEDTTTLAGGNNTKTELKSGVSRRGFGCSATDVAFSLSLFSLSSFLWHLFKNFRSEKKMKEDEEREREREKR